MNIQAITDDGPPCVQITLTPREAWELRDAIKRGDPGNGWVDALRLRAEQAGEAMEARR